MSALALLVRILVLIANSRRSDPTFLQQDSWGYLFGAESLRNGLGFTDEGGGPLVWWPPGYSCFLALVFSTGLASSTQLAGAVVAQVLLSSLVVGMTSRVAGWLGGVGPAIAAGVLMALEPSSVAYSNLIMSETLFAAGLVGMVLLWRRWCSRPGPGSLLLLAAFVGLLPLVRPVAVYLPFLLAVMIYLWGARGRPLLWAVLLFLVVSFVPAAAWSARNFRILGAPVLARVGEFEMARFAHHVEKLVGNVERSSSLKQPWEEDFGSDQGLTYAQVARARSRYFMRTVAVHPVATMRRLATSTALLLGVPDSKLPQILLSSAPGYQGGSILERLSWLRQVGAVGFLLALGMVVSVGGALAVPLLALRAGQWPRERRWLLVCVASQAFLHLVFSSMVMWQAERYRVPAIPLLCVLFSVGVFNIRRERAPQEAR